MRSRCTGQDPNVVTGTGDSDFESGGSNGRGLSADGRVERSWARAKGGVIDESELPEPRRLRRRVSDQDQIVAHLRSTRGNVAETARRMGRAWPLVHRWIKRFRHRSRQLPVVTTGGVPGVTGVSPLPVTE